MKNPAREKFAPLLSPYVDGELTPEERQQVEQHLTNNKESAAQVADFRAGGAVLRHSLDVEADAVDWKTFADDVMARVTPEKLPFFERVKLTFSEMFLYQRAPLLAGVGGVALAIAVMVPVLIKLSAQAPDGYANSKVEVQTVSVEDSANIRPVVMETDQGDAIIWTLDAKDPRAPGPDASKDGVEEPKSPAPPESGAKKKKAKGEEGEEELITTPKQEGPL